jgi:hypothetical protein
MVRREWECSSCRSFCPVIEFRGAFREYGGRKKGRPGTLTSKLGSSNIIPQKMTWVERSKSSLKRKFYTKLEGERH